MEILDRLRAALAGHYAIERELGHGGMATVYLARDERLQRRVAIKVLQPEIARALGPDRFLREIEVAARLTHPGIIPLYDSGEADGLLYYVMAFAEGETLADRLERETQLPIDDAVAIGREVAEALAYAHSQGVIHRDIKPANILLSGGHAVVADFGIARAVGQANQQKLTETGFALGTPDYMSPEQSSASAVDARSDIYSLGCVMYEMLIGGPPFSGPTAQVIAARHSAEPVSGLRHIRDTIPESVEDAVLTALAKIPADRFSTAQAFADALRPDAPVSLRGATRRLMARRGRGRRMLAAGVVVVALGATALALALAGDREPALPLDEHRAIVLPFRAGGAGDAGERRVVQTLSEMLYRRLPAGEGLVAVYPGSVRAALRDAGHDSTTADLPEGLARGIARNLGAGNIILGQVTLDAGRVTLGATLLDTRTGRELARAENITGPADSLERITDQLTATLLLARAREPASRRSALMAASVPALRSYLAGRAAFRRGSYDSATSHFATALERDSLLVPAALGFLAAAKFGDQPTEAVAGAAWTRRDRLAPEDRLFLVAMLGPRWPAAPTDSETIRGWELAVDAMPDRAEVWYLLGEAFFHSGPRIGEARALEQAGTAYRRAFELDSAFAPALLHLIDVAASARDTIALAGLADRYLLLDSAGELARYVRWRSAGATSDALASAVLAPQWNELPPAALERIISVAQIDGRSMADALQAVATFQRMIAAGEVAARSRTGLQLRVRWVSVKMRELALNRGRPAEALAITQAQQSILSGPRDRMAEIIEALFWNSDSARAAQVADRSAAVAAAAAGTPPARDDAWFDICGSGLWRVAHGDVSAAHREARRLRSVRGAADHTQSAYIPICAALIDAWSAGRERRPDAARSLEQLEALMRRGPQATTWILTAANLVLSRLHEANGDVPRALAAVRRRPSFAEYGEPRILVGLSTMLREEGRLAALAGDRAAARRALTHYLALRGDAEPSLTSEVEAVRAELARLGN